ncbi:hypothetical protein BGZ73_001601 [Actinomortierella ambigua]|nr:hypothetical protein BGZ73_001601 [Actinomortierella ambigua]
MFSKPDPYPLLPVDVDTIHIRQQASELYAGQTVPISYEIHHNGLAKLMWLKLHLMTEDGQDAGPGTIDTMQRSDWEASVASGQKTFTASFAIPSDIGTGSYILHLFGETEVPCATDPTCTGLLSDTLPVRIRATRDSSMPGPANNNMVASSSHSTVSTQLRRSLNKFKRSLYVQPEDEHLNTKRFLYLISDQF